MQAQAVAKLRQQKKRDEAVNALKTALTTKTLSVENSLALASSAMTMGEISIARNFLAGLALEGSYQTALASGAILAGGGQVKEAWAFLAPYAVKEKDNPPLQHFLGTLSAQFGKNDEAETFFRRTLQLWPSAGATWLSLMALHTVRQENADMKKMLAIAPHIHSSPPDNQSPFYYALAKAYADMGAHKEAILTYNKGATLVQKMRPYRQDAEATLVKAITGSYTAAFHESLLGSQAVQVEKPDEETRIQPVFVVGLPRSGSSLVEQILTSHSQVDGGGEINLLLEAAYALAGYTPQALFKYQQQEGAAGWQKIAALYSHLVRERFGIKGGVIVDKSLNNSRLLPLVRLVFPQAPILWMRRDPYDTAWSCFITHFNRSLDWTWGMADIAERFNEDDQLFDHFCALWPEAILPVPYAQLVADPDTWINRILSHVGLGAEAAPWEFYKNDRPVLTSSTGQVRKPLNKKGIGSSAPYQAYMTRFTEVYQGLNRDI